MSSFGDAFKSARAAGKKTFKFNGKLYTTQTKEEATKATSTRPTPKPNTTTARPTPRPSAAPASAERPKPAPFKEQGPPQNTEANIRKGLAAQGKRVSVLGRALDRLKANKGRQRVNREAARAKASK